MASEEPDRSIEAQVGEPAEIFFAAGKVYRKLPDGTIEFVGYQEVGDEPQHA